MCFLNKTIISKGFTKMRYIILFSYLWVTFLQAGSIYITDKDDNQIRVENPSIYYTPKRGSSLSLFYRPVMEDNGVRIKQGMGLLVIPWEKIGTLRIGDIHDNTISALLENNNTSTPLTLIKPADGLEGESTLGTFLIHFSNIKSISTTKPTPKNENTIPKSASISWDKNLTVTLDSNGLTSSEGIRIIGSFNLKGEDFRTINLRVKNITFPIHNILLARKDYTIYILDIKKEEMIGHFRIPSRGTPRTLDIQRDNYNFTKIQTQFRMLPTQKKDGNKKIGRPGPHITQVMVYRDGKYINEKNDKK